MLLRIWAFLFSRNASVLLFFLSYPRVTAVEGYNLLLSLLYLHVAYVLMKPTPSLFFACNCRSKHPFWQFSCPLCHLEGARWRQLAVRGALGSIWQLCAVLSKGSQDNHSLASLISKKYIFFGSFLISPQDSHCFSKGHFRRNSIFCYYLVLSMKENLFKNYPATINDHREITVTDK